MYTVRRKTPSCGLVLETKLFVDNESRNAYAQFSSAATALVHSGCGPFTAVPLATAVVVIFTDSIQVEYTACRCVQHQ